MSAEQAAPDIVHCRASPSALLPGQRAAWLGRVSRGDVVAADLGEDGAAGLLGSALAGALDELELGALLFAWRAKGVSAAELAGMMRAAQAFVQPLPVGAGVPVVVLPSYGSRRRGVALTPLLACLLADAGVRVLVHGCERADGSGTAAIFSALGIGICDDAADLSRAHARGDPAFVPIDRIAPQVATLVTRATRVGVGSLATLIARLLDPVLPAGSLRVTCYASPATHALLFQHLVSSGASALLARGCDGEVATDCASCPRIDWIHAGASDTLVRARRMSPVEQPALPSPDDPLAVARWVQSVLAGERPVPASITTQSASIVHALRRLGADPAADARR